MARRPALVPTGRVDVERRCVEVPAGVRDVDVEERVLEALGVRDLDLPPELPVPVAGRVAHHEPAERLAEERPAHQTEQERSVARQPDGCADEHESRDALGRIQREGGRPEAADRIGCDVGGQVRRQTQRRHHLRRAHSLRAGGCLVCHAPQYPSPPSDGQRATLQRAPREASQAQGGGGGHRLGTATSRRTLRPIDAAPSASRGSECPGPAARHARSGCPYRASPGPERRRSPTA